jgi:pterin-4a-carbinolamine dehydratase
MLRSPTDHRTTMAAMLKTKMMQTVTTTRILRGFSRKKATGNCVLSRSGCITRLQDRPASCRLLSSGSSNDDDKVEDGSVAGASPPQQQKRPPKKRIDPMAKRPTFRCDPYGQGGKPMSWMEAEALLATLHSDWKLVATPGKETSTATDGTPKFPPHALEREFLPTDFLSGARLVQKLATVAQLDNHFPAQLKLLRKIVRKEWQVVTQVQCHTTVLDGLSTSDFHLAMVRSYLFSIDIILCCCTRRGNWRNCIIHDSFLTLFWCYFFLHQSESNGSYCPLLLQLMDVEADRPEVKSLLLSQK